jgi:CsoR family transcriptional regulator, copper-sensing transcriptional repressor
MDHCSKASMEAERLLKTARGQIDGIIKMIEDDRYCIDVSKQLLAVIALLKKANLVVLRQHLDTCVKDAIRSDDEADEKLEEIATVLEKYLSS